MVIIPLNGAPQSFLPGISKEFQRACCAFEVLGKWKSKSTQARMIRWFVTHGALSRAEGERLLEVFEIGERL